MITDEIPGSKRKGDGRPFLRLHAITANALNIPCRRESLMRGKTMNRNGVASSKIKRVKNWMCCFCWTYQSRWGMRGWVRRESTSQVRVEVTEVPWLLHPCLPLLILWLLLCSTYCVVPTFYLTRLGELLPPISDSRSDRFCRQPTPLHTYKFYLKNCHLSNSV